MRKKQENKVVRTIEFGNTIILTVIAVMFLITMAKLGGMPKCKTTEKTEIITTGLNIMTYERGTDVICEQGVKVAREFDGTIRIYTCLDLDENMKCIGKDKKCVIRSKVRKCE